MGERKLLQVAAREIPIEYKEIVPQSESSSACEQMPRCQISLHGGDGQSSPGEDPERSSPGCSAGRDPGPDNPLETPSNLNYSTVHDFILDIIFLKLQHTLKCLLKQLSLRHLLDVGILFYSGI